LSFFHLSIFSSERSSPYCVCMPRHYFYICSVPFGMTMHKIFLFFNIFEFDTLHWIQMKWWHIIIAVVFVVFVLSSCLCTRSFRFTVDYFVVNIRVSKSGIWLPRLWLDYRLYIRKLRSNSSNPVHSSNVKCQRLTSITMSKTLNGRDQKRGWKENDIDGNFFGKYWFLHYTIEKFLVYKFFHLNI
jgi:hypothetical protein